MEYPDSLIQVGDFVRHHQCPPGVWEVSVLGVRHSTVSPHDLEYLIRDPETDEPDWVLASEFVKVIR